MEFIKGWYEGFTDGVAEVMSNLIKKDDFWGNHIYENYNFQPIDDSQGWDGTYNGKILNTGVYAYYAEILFKSGEIKIYKGDITLR